MPEILTELNSINNNVFKNIPSSTEIVSVPNNNFATVTTLDITAGTWLIIGQCSFVGNNGMNAIVMVEDVITANNTLTNSTAVRASTGNSDIQKVRIYSTSTNKTIYLRAYQNSGSDMNVTGNLRAVKLSNEY